MIWFEFLGLPGSGKSTCAAAFVDELRRRGFAAYGRDQAVRRCLRGSDGILLSGLKLLIPGLGARLSDSDYAMPDLCAFAASHPAMVAGVLESLARRQLPQRHSRTWIVPTFRTFAEYQMASDHLAASDIIVHDEGLAHRCFSMFGYLDEPVPSGEIASYLSHAPRIDYAVWTDVSPEVSNSRIEERGLGPPRLWFKGLSTAERVAFLTHGRECLANIAAGLRSSGVTVLRINNETCAAEVRRTIELWVSSQEEQLLRQTTAKERVSERH